MSKRFTYATAAKVAETITLEEFAAMVKDFNAFALHTHGGQRRLAVSATLLHGRYLCFKRCNRNGYDVMDGCLPWLRMYVFEFYNTGRVVRVARPRPIDQDIHAAHVLASLQASL